MVLILLKQERGTWVQDTKTGFEVWARVEEGADGDGTD
jgi:hypothetical protein